MHARTHRRQNTRVDARQSESTDLEVWEGIRGPLLSFYHLRGPAMIARLEFLRDSPAFVAEVALAPGYGTVVSFAFPCVRCRARAGWVIAARISLPPRYYRYSPSFENRDRQRDRRGWSPSHAWRLFAIVFPLFWILYEYKSNFFFFEVLRRL